MYFLVSITGWFFFTDHCHLSTSLSSVDPFVIQRYYKKVAPYLSSFSLWKWINTEPNLSEASFIIDPLSFEQLLKFLQMVEVKKDCHQIRHIFEAFYLKMIELKKTILQKEGLDEAVKKVSLCELKTHFLKILDNQKTKATILRDIIIAYQNKTTLISSTLIHNIHHLPDTSGLLDKMDCILCQVEIMVKRCIDDTELPNQTTKAIAQSLAVKLEEYGIWIHHFNDLMDGFGYTADIELAKRGYDADGLTKYGIIQPSESTQEESIRINLIKKRVLYILQNFQPLSLIKASDLEVDLDIISRKISPKEYILGKIQFVNSTIQSIALQVLHFIAEIWQKSSFYAGYLLGKLIKPFALMSILPLLQPFMDEINILSICSKAYTKINTMAKPLPKTRYLVAELCKYQFGRFLGAFEGIKSAF